MLDLKSAGAVWPLFLALIVCVSCQEDVGRPGADDEAEALYSGHKYIREGSPFFINCTVSVYKPFKWVKDNELIHPETMNKDFWKTFDLTETTSETWKKSSLYVQEAKPKHSGMYKCNNFSANFHTIVILTDITTNEEVEGKGKVLDVDSPFTLQCNISSNPPDNTLKIIWYKDEYLLTAENKHYVFDELNQTFTLTIPKPHELDFGAYRCDINSTELAANKTINVSVKPKIPNPFHNAKSMNLIQGDTLTLVCRYIGHPAPNVTWQKDGKDMEPGDRVTITNDEALNTSTMKMTELEEDDRADYSCIVTNSAGVTKAVLLVRVKDKLAALWPFLGIVAEVAVLCTIIFIYEKRKAKQEFEESDTDTSPEMKNTQENKDKDVRQRIK